MRLTQRVMTVQGNQIRTNHDRQDQANLIYNKIIIPRLVNVNWPLKPEMAEWFTQFAWNPQNAPGITEQSSWLSEVNISDVVPFSKTNLVPETLIVPWILFYCTLKISLGMNNPQTMRTTSSFYLFELVSQLWLMKGDMNTQSWRMRCHMITDHLWLQDKRLIFSNTHTHTLKEGCKTQLCWKLQ